MKIRNIDVDFDFLDADDVERFENEAKRVVEECKVKDKEEMSYAEVGGRVTRRPASAGSGETDSSLRSE